MTLVLKKIQVPPCVHTIPTLLVSLGHGVFHNIITRLMILLVLFLFLWLRICLSEWHKVQWKFKWIGLKLWFMNVYPHLYCHHPHNTSWCLESRAVYWHQNTGSSRMCSHTLHVPYTVVCLLNIHWCLKYQVCNWIWFTM